MRILTSRELEAQADIAVLCKRYNVNTMKTVLPWECVRDWKKLREKYIDVPELVEVADWIIED